jgi:hypothetical protein
MLAMIFTGQLSALPPHLSNFSISMAIHVVRKEGLEMTDGQLYG